MLTFDFLAQPYQVLCQVALSAIAGLLIIAFFTGRYQTERHGRMAKALQLPQSALLIGVALIVWLSAAADTSLSALAALTTLGIAFGFLGDLFMANVFRQKNHVLFGIVAFALGHICYMLGFRAIALQFNLHNLVSYSASLIGMWLIALVLWRVLVYTKQGNALQYAALIYALFLASMAAFALGIALQRVEFIGLALGGALFLLSDALLAARLFAQRAFPFIGDAIWATYIGAQVLIVCSVPLALSLI
ncbi:MAG: lysoplasmalogenase family protein [Anaerolineae bacterium]|nr:lysoplasmalogenase family protein [Anaerolineae bacterium]